MGNVNPDFSVIEAENRINNLPVPDHSSSTELASFLTGFNQVVEVLLIADNDKVNLRRYDNDHEMKVNCHCVIELVDSSYFNMLPFDR